MKNKRGRFATTATFTACGLVTVVVVCRDIAVRNAARGMPPVSVPLPSLPPIKVNALQFEPTQLEPINPPRPRTESFHQGIVGMKPDRISPLPSSVSVVTPQTVRLTDAVAEAKVWADTRTGIYYRPWQKTFGKTRDGKRISVAQAIHEGYKPAHP